MSITAKIISQCTIAETLTGNTDSAVDGSRIITHAAFNESDTLDSASNIPATKTANFVQALSGGAATIDLTSLTGTNGASVTGSGLKVQYLRVKNLGGSDLTISQGVSNPYLLKGATFKLILKTGQWDTFFGNDAAPDIGGGSKDIKLVGSGSETSEWTIVMG